MNTPPGYSASPYGMQAAILSMDAQQQCYSSPQQHYQPVYHPQQQQQMCYHQASPSPSILYGVQYPYPQQPYVFLAPQSQMPFSSVASTKAAMPATDNISMSSSYSPHATTITTSTIQIGHGHSDTTGNPGNLPGGASAGTGRNGTLSAKRNDSSAGSVHSGSTNNQRRRRTKSGTQYVCPLIQAFPTTVGCGASCKYRPRRVIGSGAYSTVWSLISNETGNVVAGKFSNLAQMSETSRNFARSEADTIRACNHPNILRLIESFEQNEQLLHIIEYADAGDLLSQVESRYGMRREKKHSAGDGGGGGFVEGVEKDSGATTTSAVNSGRDSDGKDGGGKFPMYFQEDEALIILAQLCLALNYIHSRRIMHRDLKSSNVMLCRSGFIKLGDFGYSRQYEESVSTDAGVTICGTPYYLAPELWKRQPYSFKADVWSLGVIMYEILTLRKPFPAENLQALMNLVIKENSYEPIPTSRYSDELITLVQSMLRVDAEQRLSVKEILASPIMRSRALQLLKINMCRLTTVDPAVIARVVADVEATEKTTERAAVEAALSASGGSTLTTTLEGSRAAR